MLWEGLVYVLNLLLEGIAVIAETVIGFLPQSPFLLIENISIPFIDNLNWIIPIGFMVTVTTYWLSGILVYYAYQIVLRWVKMIK